MKKLNYLVSILLVLGVTQSFAQNRENKPSKTGKVSPTVVKEAIHFSISKPLRDLPPTTGPRSDEEQAAFKKIKKEKEKKLNGEMKHRSYPYASTALPYGNDPVWQKQQGKKSAHGNNKTPILNFAGQDSPYTVSDCNGAVGLDYYMQGVNVTYAIWDKSGNQVVAPTNFNTLFQGVTGATNNDGDPIILYDEVADRWLAAEFSLPFTNNYMLVAISTTNDPTGTWYRWSFDVDDMPDYEKFGIWRDGYYMSTNNAGGEDVYAFERDVMLAGGASPKMVGFSNPNRPASDFHCLAPVDNDGEYAPVGTPGQFITINDDAWGGGNDEIWIFELNVDWANISASTFERTQQVSVASFDSNFGSSWDNIAQKGTNQKVDAVPQVLMMRAQYRNFGSTQTIVCAHTVDVDASDHAGVRWYELQNSGTGWSVRQQGTYAPDEKSRWIPSISMDMNHNIALGYNVSSSTIYPGISYCGQSATENSNALGIMDIAEEIALVGTSSHTADNRWADYAEMTVDPVDDETFWFTTEYADGGSNKATQIVSFKFEPSVVYPKDASAIAIVTPVSGVGLTDSMIVEVMFKNYGTDTITNLPVFYQLDGGSLVSEVITDSIFPGTSVNHVFSGYVDLSIPGNFEFKVYSDLLGDENRNNDTINRTVQNLLPSYCGATGGNGYEYIKKVEFGTISNSSVESEYSDFTIYSTNLVQGASENITITLSNGYSSDQCIAWVDWNQDYEFDATEKVYQSTNGVGPHTGTITVPADANIGNSRLRIRMHDTSSGPNSDPCGSSSYGEVEDYIINVALATNILQQSLNTQIQVSPNPTNNKIFVKISDLTLDGELKIVDILGNVIFQDVINGIYTKEFDFSKNSAGVYFVELIKNSATVETVKFVVQH